MKTTLSLLALIVLLGAGCVTSQPSITAPESTQDQPIESAESSEDKTWVMSTGLVLFTAPEGWSVTQGDAGVAGGIRVYSGDEEVRITVVLQDDGSVEVTTETPNGSNAQLQSIIDPIVINPSVDAQVGATIIP